MKDAIIILVVLALWLFLWLVFRQLSPRYSKKLSYIKNYKRISLGFLLAAAVVTGVFYSYILPYVYPFSVAPIFILMAFFIMTLWLYSHVKRFIKHEVIVEHQRQGIFFTSMNYRYLIAKSCNILFQQLIIILTLISLEKIGISFNYLVLIFAVIFVGSHITLLRWNFVLGLYFMLASVFAGLLFPFLILKVHYGFIYSYILHWLFYVASGVAYNVFLSKARIKLLI